VPRPISDGTPAAARAIRAVAPAPGNPERFGVFVSLGREPDRLARPARVDPAAAGRGSLGTWQKPGHRR